MLKLWSVGLEWQYSMLLHAISQSLFSYHLSIAGVAGKFEPIPVDQSIYYGVNIHTQIHTQPVDLIHMSLNCGSKTHTCTGKTCNLHTEKHPRLTQGSNHSDPGMSTTTPLCHLYATWSTVIEFVVKTSPNTILATISENLRNQSCHLPVFRTYIYAIIC